MSTRKRAAAEAWTDAHRREMRIAFHRLAIRAEIDGREKLADVWARAARMPTEDEEDARCLLGRSMALAPEDIEREIRNVRDIAEGRKVRETVWRCVNAGHPHYVYTQDEATCERRRGARVSRVTRTRRTP